MAVARGNAIEVGNFQLGQRMLRLQLTLTDGVKHISLPLADQMKQQQSAYI